MGLMIFFIYNLPPAARNLFEKRFLDLQKLLISLFLIIDVSI